MDLKLTDRAVLKELIKEILREDISIFKTALKEIIEEEAVLEDENTTDRQRKIKALIQKDFDKFEDVYKALA